MFGFIAGLSAGDASRQADPGSDTAKRFLGTWQLVSITADGKTDPNRGLHPTGLIHYDANGYMAVQIIPDRVRPTFASGEPTPDEAKAAIIGYTAYFGTYTLNEKAGTVTHHRTGNINPGGLRLLTARALGLTIPPTVLARADEVIQQWTAGRSSAP